MQAEFKEQKVCWGWVDQCLPTFCVCKTCWWSCHPGSWGLCTHKFGFSSPEVQRGYLCFKQRLPVYFLAGSLKTTFEKHRLRDLGAGAVGVAWGCRKMRLRLVEKSLDSVQEGSPPGLLSRGVTGPDPWWKSTVLTKAQGIFSLLLLH